MGNAASQVTQEQNEGAAMEAIEVFKLLDVNTDEKISAEEWEEAFQNLDSDGNGLISRKEWFLKLGTTEMYDAIHKKSTAQITHDEWQAAFDMLDTNQDGEVSVEEWMSRRKVTLGFIPLGMTLHNWGVNIGDGDQFYEVLTHSATSNEMVVAGNQGIVGFGSFTQEDKAIESWLQSFRADIDAEKKPAEVWIPERGEPRSRQKQFWQDLETVGWTMKTDEEIEAYIKEWVEAHPTYTAMSAIGGECNDQTFATDFIGWLTDTKFSRMTDNTKGRAILYGGLALLATAGGVYLATRNQNADGAGGQRSLG